VRTVILPRRNEKNLMEDVPAAVRDAMTFHLVDSIPEVLDKALDEVAVFDESQLSAQF
jgi:ATP-dependent Lon protease